MLIRGERTFELVEEARELVVEEDVCGLLAVELGTFGGAVVALLFGDLSQLVGESLHADSLFDHAAHFRPEKIKRKATCTEKLETRQAIF